MRTTSYSPRVRRAITMVEVLAIMAVIAVLVAMLLPGLLHRPRQTWPRCASNLKQIALSFQLFAMDNENRFPMAVATNEGGAREFGPDAAAIFRSLSNDLATARVLVCPQDQRTYATNFVALQVNQISYFLNFDASPASSTNQWLCGDRNLIIDRTPAGPGLANVSTNTQLGWGADMHQRWGMIVFTDGRVMGSYVKRSAASKAGAVRLSSLPRAPGTNRLLFPVPKL